MQASVTNPDSCIIDDRLEVFNMNAVEELELSDHVVPEHSGTDTNTASTAQGCSRWKDPEKNNK